MRSINTITEAVIGAAIDVHRELGPGLLESTYEICLASLIHSKGLLAERQVAMPITFQGIWLDNGYRVDLLVERQVIVELKANRAFAPIHIAQLNTYLKLSGCEVGLLINFNVLQLRHGLRRLVNHHAPPDPRAPPAVLP